MFSERHVICKRTMGIVYHSCVFHTLKGSPPDTNLITPVVPSGKRHHRCNWTSPEQRVPANSPKQFLFPFRDKERSLEINIATYAQREKLAVTLRVRFKGLFVFPCYRKASEQEREPGLRLLSEPTCSPTSGAPSTIQTSKVNKQK